MEHRIKGAEKQFLDQVNRGSTDGIYETGGASIRDPTLGSGGLRKTEPGDPDWYKKLEGDEASGGVAGWANKIKNRFAIQDERSGGKLSAYVQDQQKKTMSRLQENAKEAHEDADKFLQKMSKLLIFHMSDRKFCRMKQSAL